MGTPVCCTAPWEEVEVPERNFKVCVSQTLSRSTDVDTQDYTWDKGEEYPDTSETNWKTTYLAQHYSPFEIIENTRKIAQTLIAKGQTSVAGVYLPSLLRDCRGWICDDFEVVEE